MEILNIIDKAARQQIAKTENGSNRMLGVLAGIVVKNYSKEMPGHVCVRIPTMDEEADVMKWVPVISLSGGTSWGHYFLPEVGDHVLLAFENGNVETPYVIGSILQSGTQLVKKAADKNNNCKRIMTRHGTNITMMDIGDLDEEGKDTGDGEPGEKDQLVVQTALQMYTFTMDNEKKQVTLSDKEGKNKIALSTAEGKEKLSIVVAKKVELKVGDGITISMDGESGNMTVKGKKIKLEAENGLEFQTNGSAKVKGSNIMLEADSTFKANSSGVVQISGSPIKIG